MTDMERKRELSVREKSATAERAQGVYITGSRVDPIRIRRAVEPKASDD